MAQHDFARLFSHYAEIIAGMPQVFTSHEFILQLAQKYQTEYVEALYAYRQNLWEGRPAPFLIVHGQLAQHLQQLPGLIAQIPGQFPSTDIFGHDSTCARWYRK